MDDAMQLHSTICEDLDEINMLTRDNDYHCSTLASWICRCIYSDHIFNGQMISENISLTSAYLQETFSLNVAFVVGIKMWRRLERTLASLWRQFRAWRMACFHLLLRQIYWYSSARLQRSWGLILEAIPDIAKAECDWCHSDTRSRSDH